jgi:hypothetical protein
VGQRAANSGWPNGSNCAVNGKWGTPMGRRRSRKSMCRNPLLSKCPRLKKCPGRCPGALCHQAVHQVARLLRHSRALLARSEESRHSEGAAAAAPSAPINNSPRCSRRLGIDPEPRNRAPRPRPLIHPHCGAIRVLHHAPRPLRACDRMRSDRCDQKRQKDSGTCCRLEAPFGFRL